MPRVKIVTGEGVTPNTGNSARECAVIAPIRG